MCERGRPPVTCTPPFSSMAELMEGELKYVVAVPDLPDATLTVQVLQLLLRPLSMYQYLVPLFENPLLYWLGWRSSACMRTAHSAVFCLRLRSRG